MTTRNLPTDHTSIEAQQYHVGGDSSSQQATKAANPTPNSPAGDQTSAQTKDVTDTRTFTSGRNPLATPDQIGSDYQGIRVGGGNSPVFNPILIFLAGMVDDLESLRKANDNRMRIMLCDQPDKDGVVRGMGLPPETPAVQAAQALLNGIEAQEHAAVLALQKEMRNHPLWPEVKHIKGVGQKTLARLLATIGDPAVNSATGELRGLSQLWSYCGLHVWNSPTGHARLDAHASSAGGGASVAGGETNQGAYVGVAPRRVKGHQANWSTKAKTRAWNCIDPAFKMLDPACKTDSGIAVHREGCGCSPYRIAIDKRRAHTAITHPEWTPIHSLNDGRRIASKQLLKDLWLASRRVHGISEETP